LADEKDFLFDDSNRIKQPNCGEILPNVKNVAVFFVVKIYFIHLNTRHANCDEIALEGAS
jgi:hypothetical protein